MIHKILMTAATFALLGAPLRAQTGLPLGTRAPDASVETVDGKPAQLAQYIAKGKPTLIQFWATWCSNCKALEPQMAAAAKKYAGKVALVGVAVGVNQSAALVKRYAAKHALPLAVLYDKTGDAADKYDVPATSYIVVLDRSGKIVYTGVGSEQNVEAAIRRAL
ncbi:MAG TPA: TlpA disulfide reductase family protein [Gemmatimonadaceae bacterium]|nr:TlpA disulfide reductase family protein [Gemmatimonadaceae bacterium]